MKIITHKFVEQIPRQLDDDVIYISLKYSTAIHKCFCGCQEEVITPFSPTDWQLAFDGKTISLSPSIGNWNFKCQSHYWIRNNQMVWAKKWSDIEIEAGRRQDLLNKERYYAKKKDSYWSKVIRWFKR
ncbi:MAG: DUF6527 family protein [bacterium]|nr:DUF6527 family protein [bacterium]